MESHGRSFWTMCPYCHFKYEHLSVYADCVLRCKNDKCKSAFRAVVVAASEVPTPEEVEKAKSLPVVIDLTHDGDEMEAAKEINDKGDADGKNSGNVGVRRRRRKVSAGVAAKNKVTGKGIPAKFDPSKRNMKDVEEVLDLLFGKEDGGDGAGASGM